MVNEMVRTQQISETSKRALRYYHDEIKPQLTKRDTGRFVAIDSNSGAWEISDDRDAVDKLKARVPDAYPFLLVHPRIWVDSWGGGFPAPSQ